MNVKIRIICSSLILILMTSVNALAYKVIPCGEALGVIVKTQGILVVGTTKITDRKGHSVNPAKKAGLMKGDRIISVNGQLINSADELTDIVKICTNEISMNIIRNAKRKNITLMPAQTADGAKLGIYVRDSAAGIGTITYINPQTGEFAGLGHGICDIDTNTILPINGGYILDCELSAPTKGKSGFPGELNGLFVNNTLGSIKSNSNHGISGFINNIPKSCSVDVAKPDEITAGDAYIYSEVDNSGIQKFSVRILSVDKSDPDGKNMTIEITDKQLISKTGGIVQGMSGSPIIQNEKIIGAVTHVFVNNPLKGYGIFIGNMIDTQE